jgi:hypothetical protein
MLLKKKRELKYVLHVELLKGQKAARQREHCSGKGKDAYSRLQILQMQRVFLLLLMRMSMSENQACQSHVHVTALRYLRFKPRRMGLNRRLKPGLRGGGWVLTHYLIM